MKNFIINPAAKNIELRVRIGIDELQTLGWDFDTYHKNTADAMGISIEAAEQHNLQNHIAEISLKGNSDNIKTDYTWYSHSRNENTEYEATGDNEQTVQDIIGLLNNEELSINDNWDYTTDESGEYVPTFIENYDNFVFVSENDGDGKTTFWRFNSEEEAKSYIEKSINNWVNNGIDNMDDSEVEDYANGLFEIIENPSYWVLEQAIEN